MLFDGLNSGSLLSLINELLADSSYTPISCQLRDEVSKAVARGGVPKTELQGLSWLATIPMGVGGILGEKSDFIHSINRELSPPEVAASLFYAFERPFLNPKTSKDLLWDIVRWKIWILQEFQKTLPPIDAETESTGAQWQKFQIMLQHLRLAEAVAEGSTNYFSMSMPGAPTVKFEGAERSQELYLWRKSAISDCVRSLASVRDEENLSIETQFVIGLANARLQPHCCSDQCIEDLKSLCTETGICPIKVGALLMALNEVFELKSSQFFADLIEFIRTRWRTLTPPMN